MIDASILHAAGGEGASAPVPKLCRGFLLDVLTICHRAVVTPEIRTEWQRHSSRFAGEWLVAMRRKGKMVHIEPPADQGLGPAIERLDCSERARNAMLKDCLLLDAALATDRTVVSLDEEARSHFAASVPHLRPLRAIVWVNPVREEEQAPDWLRAGAQSNRYRTLRYWPPAVLAQSPGQQRGHLGRG